MPCMTRRLEAEDVEGRVRVWISHQYGLVLLMRTGRAGLAKSARKRYKVSQVSGPYGPHLPASVFLQIPFRLKLILIHELLV